ncbi:MAG: hypothetical protein JWN36_1544 [Microbacteriaceae bacterium]|nr:hypothetical protein [Microbacteriaceae bacterium]
MTQTLPPATPGTAPSEIRLPPGELQRLAECVLEPIRFPGAVQAHGVLLAMRRDDLVITHVSDNAGTVLGAEPVALFGRRLDELVGADAVAGVRDILDPATNASNPLDVTVGGVTFDAIAHEGDDLVIVEFEPQDAEVAQRTADMRAAFRRLATAPTVTELWRESALELRRITGFDRVMVYHFHPDGHGEVVGEARADDMEPYLGLHYPASDIPAQARALYVTKLSRMIASSDGPAATLLADANVPQRDLDLGGAELRAVSPHHLEFMRNMGQASTFSLSLVRAGELVGMITCAHRTPRRIGYGVREGLEILANQVALQLAGMVEIARLAQRDELRHVRAALLRQVGDADDLPRALLRDEVTLLDLIPADGAAIHLGDRIETIGEAPSAAQVAALGDELVRRHGSLSFTSNAIRLDHPELAPLMPNMAGVMVSPLGDGDYIAWFRGEVTQTVDWLGDMSPRNRQTPLSPRNSFSAWSEDVTGTSLPWTLLEDEAVDLCRDLGAALLHRASSQLAELALRDPLTGLPNRRLLMDRLSQALSRADRAGLAVLFIDLDRFKQINDTLGHAAGDDVLVRVAECLRATARAEDTVARLGGDEFVVLCENTTRAQAEAVASRVRAAVAELGDSGSGVRIAASVGVSMAAADSDASQVLTAADAAMYRAKVAGR